MVHRASTRREYWLILVGLAVAGMTGRPAGAQAPEWTVNPSAFESNMSVAAAVFDGGIRLSNQNDVVAAFVDGEVRGVATAQQVGVETVFLLTVYSNDPAEVVAFRAYDALSDQVRIASETVAFVPNATIGTPSEPLVLSVSGSAGANRPTWSVDPAAFGSTMNVVAELFVGGEASGGAEFLLAAFAGADVRGVAAPMLVDGRWLFFLTVYGESEGESVSFQAYDSVQDAVVTVDETAVFRADDLIGSTTLPLALHADSAPGVNRPSWTVNPSEFESTMNLTAALYTNGVRSERSADLVAAFVNDEVRGVASPTNVDGRMIYFLTIYGQPADTEVTFRVYDSGSDEVKNLAETLEFVPDAVHGSPGHPFIVSTPPEGGTGANDPEWSVDATKFGLSMSIIGSLTLDGAAVRHSGVRVAAFVGEEIRGVAAPLDVGGRSLFFLTVHAVGVGEKISFRAYDAAADRQRGIGPNVTFEPDAVRGSTSTPFVWGTSPGPTQPIWIPDSSAYALEMTLVGQLLINDEVSTHPDNILAAFAGSDLRGSAKPSVVDGHLVHRMTLYANADGETIRFEAYDAAADRVRPVLETIVFAAASDLGTPEDPVRFTTPADPPQAAPLLLSPTNDQVNVPLDAALVWNEVSRADSYEIEVSTSPDFADSQTLTGTTTSATPTEPLAVATLYYWRARAINSGGPGPWSEVWSFSTRPSGVANEDEGAGLPDRFALGQNYPNPFNPTTHIHYDLAAPARVRLAIHDLLGRKVATLVDEVQPAGSYSRGFDGSGLGSGLYVYRIEAGSFTATRTMTLIK